MKKLKLFILSFCAALCVCFSAYADENPVPQRKIAFVEDTGYTESSEEVDDSEYIYLGTFKLTAYCRCRLCNGSFVNQPTSYGTDYVEGRTIAVDRRVIPLGSYVEINIPGEGWHEYHAEDTGSAIKGNRIDIFVEGHPNCLQDRYNVPCEVRIKKEP